MSTINISLAQLEDMKHAIGYSAKRVKRGKYNAYRNYYHNGYCDNKYWNDLIKNGYATLNKHTRNVDGSHIYHVTDLGISLLEKLLDIKVE